VKTDIVSDKEEGGTSENRVLATLRDLHREEVSKQSLFLRNLLRAKHNIF